MNARLMRRPLVIEEERLNFDTGEEADAAGEEAKAGVVGEDAETGAVGADTAAEERLPDKSADKAGDKNTK